MAVVWSKWLLKPYLVLSRFIVRTDRKDLRLLLTSASGPGKLTGRRLRLHELDFEVFHRIGIKRQAAKALSGPKTDENK